LNSRACQPALAGRSRHVRRRASCRGCCSTAVVVLSVIRTFVLGLVAVEASCGRRVFGLARHVCRALSVIQLAWSRLGPKVSRSAKVSRITTVGVHADDWVSSLESPAIMHGADRVANACRVISITIRGEGALRMLRRVTKELPKACHVTIESMPDRRA
jgi:hypothetical protein